ncbi:MAG: hypothetical protein LBE38_11835 [Deltaproteobacteria bacterium]|jgi:hypothetical protein|nr:hypothetical protein [Deltaproteobacteria bacterium]
MDMTSTDLRRVTRFARWHLAYIALVLAFFSRVYMTGSLRANFFLEERFIFLVLAPCTTLLFVLICPWRKNWLEAIKTMYQRLEGQEIFCVLAALVFLIGFFFYSLLIWGLGAIIPSIVYWW